MKRRAFIKSLFVLSVGSLYLNTGCASRSDETDFIYAIKDYFPEYNHSDTVILRFYEEYKRLFNSYPSSPKSTLKKKIKKVIGRPIKMDKIAQLYLFSTNALSVNSNNQTLEYRQFYNPYVSPCYNPYR